MRSCSSFADDTTVRRYKARSPSPASAVAVSIQPAAVLAGRKENKPVLPGSGSTTSLVGARLLDSTRLNTPPSPRRSWSWAVSGDNWDISSYDLISRFQWQVEDTKPAEIACLEAGNRSVNSALVDVEVEASNPDKVDDDNRPPLLLRPFLEALTPGLSDPILVSVRQNVLNHASQIGDASDQSQSSPFKRWLKGLKKRHIWDPEAFDANRAVWTSSDALSSRLQLPPLSGHKKTPSSVASTAFLAAVKTASETMTSLSLYPVSRRSLQANCHREKDSHREQTDRGSFDSLSASQTPLIDDGTCSRSLQRRRIVQELISSEESYIRDLKTLLNV
jgi:hypothetical protein